ncbi:MAG: GntR family transcriptional regulator [Oscillospiraceae bacterium]|nr:GntR family transcriptional regulator [Oscillospiraceae bacterium]
MISFEGFKPEDGSPLYYQILRHIRRGIASGVIVDGDALPSRRVLSATLGINPNTVQRAYSELEEEGLVSNRSGAKSYVVLNADTVERVRRELIESEARTLVGSLKKTGVTKDGAVELVERFWEEEEEL